jgi:hypothetical protein
MTQLSLFKLINFTLLVLNAVVFFAPKKPMNNVTANAAGILALIALVVIIVFVTHLILTLVATYFNKSIMLTVMAVIMVPASMVFWYYTVPMIRF